jgi:nucleotide-binding universal stress UspA family protein
MPEHVLIPYDGSPLADRALEYACSEFSSSALTALFVIDKRTDETAAVGWGDHPSEWEDWLTERRQHAESLFEPAESIAAEHGATIDTAVAIGETAEMVIRVAEEYGADLIVVGTHGQSPLEDLLISNVAKALVRRSPVPVTTVREEAA